MSGLLACLKQGVQAFKRPVVSISPNRYTFHVPLNVGQDVRAGRQACGVLVKTMRVFQSIPNKYLILTRNYVSGQNKTPSLVVIFFTQWIGHEFGIHLLHVVDVVRWVR